MQIHMVAKLTSDSGSSTHGTIQFTNEHGIAFELAAEIAQVITRRGWELEVRHVPQLPTFEEFMDTNSDGLIEDHAWVRSRPTLTDEEECAICDQPRMRHETVDG